MEKSYLYNTEKIKYVKGDRPAVECILCAIRDNDPLVKNLIIHSTEKFIIAVNLFPFNPGHLMIFPKRHICQINELTNEEAVELHELLAKTITILDEEFKPSGYNVGYNIGEGSGASIPHLHQHIVPRYPNEVGFLDVLSGTRVIVNNPVDTMERLKKKFSNL
ncbi:MAG: HIT domain-containing protein [Spirochaetes bacterium]|nr:HIT domain-containing protein [Spirochaetota bacterium]